MSFEQRPYFDIQYMEPDLRFTGGQSSGPGYGRTMIQKQVLTVKRMIGMTMITVL